jgi:hypothetical protein
LTPDVRRRRTLSEAVAVLPQAQKFKLHALTSHNSFVQRTAWAAYDFLGCRPRLLNFYCIDNGASDGGVSPPVADSSIDQIVLEQWRRPRAVPCSDVRVRLDAGRSPTGIRQFRNLDLRAQKGRPRFDVGKRLLQVDRQVDSKIQGYDRRHRWMLQLGVLGQRREQQSLQVRQWFRADGSDRSQVPSRRGRRLGAGQFLRSRHRQRHIPRKQRCPKTNAAGNGYRRHDDGQDPDPAGCRPIRR